MRSSVGELSGKERHEFLFRVTPAYREEVLRLVIQEASAAARELNLPDDLPITRETLAAAYVSPPRLRRFGPGFGNVTTAKYHYVITVGSKLSSIVRAHLDEECAEYRLKYMWDWSRVDTNAAYQLATQWMASASMDLRALGRECQLSVAAWTPSGSGRPFVPLYTVQWAKDGEGVAMVQVFLPMKRLCQLSVQRSEYILRKPLTIPNTEFLLSQTNGVARGSPSE
jgi:hypothetical protein